MAKNTKPTGPGAAAQPSGDDAHGRQATETPAQPSDDAQESQPDAKPAACPCRSDCRRGKLHSFDWLADIPGDKAASDIVEVQFKNTGKDISAIPPTCRSVQATSLLSRPPRGMI